MLEEPNNKSDENIKTSQTTRTIPKKSKQNFFKKFYKKIENPNKKQLLELLRTLV